MKSINIISLTQAYHSLNYESYLNFRNHHGIGIKDEEIDDLTSLATTLAATEKNKNIFNNFYVGYQIPQIGKEFDLLRFGQNHVINVELKKKSTPDKVQKQLKRNKYYLSFIGKKIYSFGFISSTSEFYYLRDDDVVEAIEPSQLAILLKETGNDNIKNIDDLFNPSDYLVSPFNSTDKFVNGEYFLTHQQEEIAHNILNTINLPKTTSYISIKGSAGTGKTLLVYDIAKELINTNKTPLIIHCGNLNPGQIELITKYQWQITPIKNYAQNELAQYDVIIVDEAQRIHLSQLENIVNKIQSTNGKCIFSYDKLQTLATWEDQSEIDDKISKINSIVTYTLTEKIRTNKEIASFIKALFNKNSPTQKSRTANIEINFFDNTEDAKHYLDSLNDQDWEILRFTPSQYNKEHHEKYSDISCKTSHRVIGQEFDSVAITIDNFFSYHSNGDLIYTGKAYYNPVKMLFQNITRTRKRLNIVIINNSILLNRCLSALNG